MSINNRGKSEIELGYNKKGDLVEIDFCEGNTVMLSSFFYDDMNQKIRYHWKGDNKKLLGVT